MIITTGLTLTLALALNVQTIELPAGFTQDEAAGRQAEAEIAARLRAVKPSKPEAGRDQPTLRLYRGFDLE